MGLGCGVYDLRRPHSIQDPFDKGCVLYSTFIKLMDGEIMWEMVSIGCVGDGIEHVYVSSLAHESMDECATDKATTPSDEDGSFYLFHATKLAKVGSAVKEKRGIHATTLRSDDRATQCAKKFQALA
jgi:hypothetical protein